jgi:hypothetical protein
MGVTGSQERRRRPWGRGGEEEAAVRHGGEGRGWAARRERSEERVG